MATPPNINGQGSNVLATLFAAAAASMQRQAKQHKQPQQPQQQPKQHQNQRNWTSSSQLKPSQISDTNNIDSGKSQDLELEAKRETLCQLLNLKPQSNSSRVASIIENAVVAPSTSQKNKQKLNDLGEGGSDRQRTKLSHHINNNSITCSSTSIIISSSSKKQNGTSPSKSGSSKESQKKLLSKTKTQKADKEGEQKLHVFTTTNGVSHSNNPTELRNLEFWHDEDEQNLDGRFYQELADSNNTDGWKADDMFEYNERMHKIHTTYNERTLSDKYTTSLPKLGIKSSKSRVRMATKLAEEIEQSANGHITPESSDDDEQFENERLRRLQLRQRQEILNQNRRNNPINHQLDQQSQNHMKGPTESKLNNKGTKSSSRNSNSTETPATASLSSSPTLNEPVRPITSSSRNILRTCLSMT